MDKQEFYEMLFSELELSDPKEAAREETKNYLVKEGYEVELMVPIKEIKHCYDIVATKDGKQTALIIGNHSVRKLRLGYLKQFDGDKVYLLRGNARYNGYINNVNVINVMSKGNL